MCCNMTLQYHIMWDTTGTSAFELYPFSISPSICWPCIQSDIHARVISMWWFNSLTLEWNIRCVNCKIISLIQWWNLYFSNCKFLSGIHSSASITLSNRLHPVPWIYDEHVLLWDMTSVGHIYLPVWPSWHYRYADVSPRKWLSGLMGRGHTVSTK